MTKIESLTCQDCEHFTGTNCLIHPVNPPAYYRITGPPQCSSFQLKPKTDKMSIYSKKFKKLNNLDTYPDDPTFIQNVSDEYTPIFEKAAQNLNAEIKIEYAKKDGKIYLDQPIFSIFLVSGTTKKKYLAEIKKITEENSNPLLKTNFAEIEQKMTERQEINLNDVYEMYGWEGDEYDPWIEEYKFDEGFIQNINQSEVTIYQKAADNLNIKIEFKDEATDIHGKPLPDLLELYIPKEEERTKSKELFNEIDKIKKQAQKNPDSTFEKIYALSKKMPALYKPLLNDIYHFYWNKDNGPIPNSTALNEKINSILPNLNKTIEINHKPHGAIITFKFHKSLSNEEDRVLEKLTKKEKLLPVPASKQTTAALKKIFPNNKDLCIQTQTEVAAKAKMLQKLMNDKIIEENQNIIKEGNESFDWAPLCKDLGKGSNIPGLNVKPISGTYSANEEQWQKLLTVSTQDAEFYQIASKELKIGLRIVPSELSGYATLYDVYILKNQTYIAHKIIDLANKLSKYTQKESKGIEKKTKKSKKKDCKLGQRKLKFKKD